MPRGQLWLGRPQDCDLSIWEKTTKGLLLETQLWTLSLGEGWCPSRKGRCSWSSREAKPSSDRAKRVTSSK